jgi:hypothetical protein
MLGGEYCDIKARSDQKVPPKKSFSFRRMIKAGSAYDADTKTTAVYRPHC